MLKTTCTKLHHFLINETETFEDYCDECIEGPVLTRAEWEQIYALRLTGDIKDILASAGMSADYLGGDDIVSYVDQALDAVQEGYAIKTWYGDKTETLIVGFKPGKLEIEG